MQKIYLLLGEEQKGPYSEEEVQEMYAAGTINPETLHWKDDMTAWEALGTRPPNKAPAPVKTVAPPRRTERPGRYPIEHKPVKSEEEIEEEDGLPTGVRPATVLKTLAIIIVFFVLMTGLIKMISHTMPDIGKKFANGVAHASNQQ